MYRGLQPRVIGSLSCTQVDLVRHMRRQLRNQSLVWFLVALHSHYMLLRGRGWRTVCQKVLILIYFVFQILSHLQFWVSRSCCFALCVNHWQEIRIGNLAWHRSCIWYERARRGYQRRTIFRLLMFVGLHSGGRCCFDQLRIGERAVLLLPVVKADVRLVLRA